MILHLMLHLLLAYRFGHPPDSSRFDLRKWADHRRLVRASPRHGVTYLSNNEQFSSTCVTLPPKLTVLIPAYNEKFRIGTTLTNYESYLAESKWKSVTSVLIIDDGSSDGTSDRIRDLVREKKYTIPMECLTLADNKGKGGALAYGIQHIYGQYPSSVVLTADADGSANINDLDNMFHALIGLLQKNFGDTYTWDRPALVSGCRTYESAAPGRLFFRWGFRTTVRWLVGDLGVRDSQCGFKLMTTSTAQRLYSDLRVMGWSHDVEVLYRAKLFAIPVTDYPISWEDKDGSKLAATPGGVLAVSVTMFLDVLRLRIMYGTGSYRD